MAWVEVIKPLDASGRMAVMGRHLVNWTVYRKTQCTQCTVQCTVYTMYSKTQCTVYTVYSKAQCTVYTVYSKTQCTVYKVYSKAQCMVYTEYRWAQCTVYKVYSKAHACLFTPKCTMKFYIINYNNNLYNVNSRVPTSIAYGTVNRFRYPSRLG